MTLSFTSNVLREVSQCSNRSNAILRLLYSMPSHGMCFVASFRKATASSNSALEFETRSYA